jgi:hypothetical protein
VPVDRGSEAARVRSGNLRPRAPQLALVFAACLPEGALSERDSLSVAELETNVNENVTKANPPYGDWRVTG